MEIPNPIEFVRQHPTMFTGSEFPSADQIWGDVATGAALITGGLVSIVHECGWYFVASKANWIGTGTKRDVFTEIVPFPERGRNAFRPEIMVTAFATAAVVSQCGVLRNVVGLSPPNESAACSEITSTFDIWLAFTLIRRD